MKWMEAVLVVILLGFVLGCSAPDEEIIARLQDENQQLKDEKTRLETTIVSLQEELDSLRNELAGWPPPEEEAAVQQEDNSTPRRHFRRQNPTLPIIPFPDEDTPQRSRSSYSPPRRSYPSHYGYHPSRPTWNVPTPSPTPRPRSRDLVQPVPPCDQHHHGMCVDRDGTTHTRRRR